MKVKIIGTGAWGSALFSLIKHNNADVSFIGEQKTSTDQDVLVLALPTQNIRDALSYISFSGKSKIIINTSKGIEKETHMLPYQIVREVCGNDVAYYSLIGPSFAQEVRQEMPTLVTLGIAGNEKQKAEVSALFQTDFFKLRLSSGVEALELAAAFKNIYAIVCGLAHGLGYESNTKINLILLALEEMNELYAALGISVDQCMMPELIGDLLLTCSSITSRNFAFGASLAHHSVAESVRKVSGTIEGIDSLASVAYMKQTAGVRLPLATFITQIVQRDNPDKVKEAFLAFMMTT